MSINTSHSGHGVIIYAGELILSHNDGVSVVFQGHNNGVFKGAKKGRVYLTTNRMIFTNKKANDPLQSFSAPFQFMSDVKIKQPLFCANYIRATLRAQPNGNFVGMVKFRIYFKSGGAIEFGQDLMRIARAALSNMRSNVWNRPPPYTPTGAWFQVPPPSHRQPPAYTGPPNTILTNTNPPPYPGIGRPLAEQPTAAQWRRFLPGWNSSGGDSQPNSGYQPLQNESFNVSPQLGISNVDGNQTSAPPPGWVRSPPPQRVPNGTDHQQALSTLQIPQPQTEQNHPRHLSSGTSVANASPVNREETGDEEQSTDAQPSQNDLGTNNNDNRPANP